MQDRIFILCNVWVSFPERSFFPLFLLFFSFFPSLLLMVSLFWLHGGAWWAAVYGVTQSRTRLKWLSSSSRVLITDSPFSLCFAHACLTTLFLAYLHQLSDLQKQKSSIPPAPNTHKSIMYIFQSGFKSSYVSHKDKNPYKRMTTVFFSFHVSN